LKWFISIAHAPEQLRMKQRAPVLSTTGRRIYGAVPEGECDKNGQAMVAHSYI
jgi:hypothetical protein